MNLETDSIWLRNIIERREGFELAAVDRFSERLLLFARKRLPDPLKRRLDAEDVVQSVFRSFFARHREGQFQFSECNDVWRLLAAMTWRKLIRTIRHHSQQQRDFHREFSGEPVRTGDIFFRGPEPTASSIAIMMEFLASIMGQLPEPHQKILELRLENHSIEEIADRLHYSVRTVSRTLKTIREIAYEMTDREKDG